MQKNDNKKVTGRVSMPLSPFHIELDKTARGFSLSCSGVKGISEFSDTKIRIRLSSFSVDVFGEGLYMTVFEGRCVEIIGKFLEMRFVYGKS